MPQVEGPCICFVWSDRNSPVRTGMCTFTAPAGRAPDHLKRELRKVELTRSLCSTRSVIAGVLVIHPTVGRCFRVL